MERRTRRGNLGQSTKHGLTFLLGGALLLGCGKEAPIGAAHGDQDFGRDAGGQRGTTSHQDSGAELGRDGGLGPELGNDAVALVAASLEVDWDNCSLYTGEPIGERPFNDAASDAGVPARPPAVTAKCAILKLPLRWSEPGGRTIDWFVKKVPAVETSRGQLWLLQGGPGSPGVGMEYLADDLHAAIPDLDIYVPDHRGVGRSTLFECEDALGLLGTTPSQVIACGEELMADWGADTGEFNTTSAARDVAAVATRFHRSGEEVIVWGGSYGGYLAHRVLQVDRAKLFTAAAFDSTALPIGGLSTAYQVLKPNAAGDALLAACAEDEECGARLGPDPKERALVILDNLCEPLQRPGRGGRVGVQGLISGALREWRFLRLVPAILYRAERCTDADVDYLDAFARALSSEGPAEAPEAPASRAVFLHIMYTEVISELSARQEIIEASEAEVFSDIGGAIDLRAAMADWPHYAQDEFMGTWAESDIPMLILHGGLDTQTPRGEGQAVADHFTGENQQFFFFPTGQHGIYFRTHDLVEDEDTGCGEHVTKQFLRSPTSVVDGSCIEDTPPLDFSANEALLLELAGHTDVWDNPEE